MICSGSHKQVRGKYRIETKVPSLLRQSGDAVNRGLDLESGRLELECGLRHLLAKWSWARHFAMFASVSLSVKLVREGNDKSLKFLHQDNFKRGHKVRHD